MGNRFTVKGVYIEKKGYVIARSSDGRFVTRGSDRADALKKMDALVTGYQRLADKHKFDATLGPSSSHSEKDIWEVAATA